MEYLGIIIRFNLIGFNTFICFSYLTWFNTTIPLTFIAKIFAMNLRITNHKMWPHFYVYTFTISQQYYYLMIVTTITQLAYYNSRRTKPFCILTRNTKIWLRRTFFIDISWWVPVQDAYLGIQSVYKVSPSRHGVYWLLSLNLDSTLSIIWGVLVIFN